MRNNINLTLGLLCSVFFASADTTWAVPITGGSGPGGIKLTNLTLWLDANAITGVGDGAQFMTWSDQSGKGNDGVQVTPDRRPVWNDDQQNGRAVVTFDGATDGNGDFFDLGPNNLFDMTTSDGFSLFTVTNLTGFPGAHPEILSAKSGLSDHIQFFRSSQSTYADFSIGSDSSARVRAAATSDFQNNVMQTMTSTYSGADINTNGNYGLFIDGNAQTVSASAAFANNPNTNNSILGTDGTIRNDQRWQGDMAEIIVFDREVNSTERVILQNYLSAKYDIAFHASASADDHYEGDDNIKGDYDADVFGIGNDGSSLFDSSGSEGLGIEATGGTLNSGEFVLAGHTATGNGLTTANVPTGQERWQRVWYIDANTDFGDGVDATLGFGWSDSGMITSFDPRFGTLFYSPTDPYSFTEIASASSTIGDQVFFDLSSLASGYYTLGTAPVPEPSSLLLLGLGALGLVRQTQRARRRA